MAYIKSYQHTVVSGEPLSCLNMPEFWDACRKKTIEEGNNAIITWARPYESLTHLEILGKAELVSKGMLCLGLRRGDSLCSFGVRGSDALVTFLACSCIGVIYMHPYAPTKKIIKEVIEKVEPTAVMLGDEFIPDGNAYILNEAKEVLAESHRVKIIIYDTKAAGNDNFTLDRSWIPYSQVVEQGHSADKECQDLSNIKRKLDLNEPCYITMSSGTTGKPKFILMGAAVLTNFARNNDKAAPNTVVACPEMCDEEAYPLYAMALQKGYNLVFFPLEDQHDVNDIVKEKLSVLEKYKVNVFYCSSYYMTLIAKQESLRTQYDLSTVKSSFIAGSVTNKEFKEQILKFAPYSMHVYSCSEISNPVSTSPGFMAVNADTVGKPTPNVEMKIVDEDGVIVPVRTCGEIYLRSARMFIEYRNDPDLTKAVITKDGWFKTGDCGYMDEEGYVYIMGRIATSERFKVHGDVVYPSAIEGVMCQHQKIKDCVVVGVPADGGNGHELVYLIIPEANEKITEDEVVNYARESLTFSIEWPTRIFFYDKFPFTSGSRKKILRRKLQEEIIGFISKEA